MFLMRYAMHQYISIDEKLVQIDHYRIHGCQPVSGLAKSLRGIYKTCLEIREAQKLSIKGKPSVILG